MARQTITRLIDDLDQTEADETVKFGLDGVQYEIDLSAKNAAKLRDLLQPYIAAGKRLNRGGGRAATRRGRAQPPSRDENRRIREWARSRNLKVSDRGRISKEIVEQYRAAGGR